MSGFPVFPKPDPGASSDAPWDFATFLQRTADLRIVTQGPGGTTVVLPKDTLFAPPPSQQGIEGSKAKLSVKTSDPKLDEPGFAGLGLWSIQFATTVIQILIGTMKDVPRGIDSISTTGESIAATLAYREEALHQALVEAGLVSSDTETGTHVFEGNTTVGPEGVEDRTAEVNDTSVNAAFLAWVETLSKATSTPLTPLSQSTQTLLSAIHSTDAETVAETLVDMANLPSLNLSPSTKALILSKIGDLAALIAQSNKSGGAFVIGMTVPGLMIPVFMESLDMSTDTSMTTTQKGDLSTALYNICISLAHANLEKAVSTKTPSREYTDLVSEDPQKVGMLLFTIAGTMPLPHDVKDTDMIGAINGIATTLCSLSPEDKSVLQSTDKSSLTELFMKGLDGAEDTGLISPSVKAALIPILIPLLVDQTAQINQVKLTGDLSSQDPADIEKALTFLTGVGTDKSINNVTKHVAMSYIQALVSAMVYLGNMRALMLQMETEFTQELGAAKISNISESLQIAQLTYTKALQNIDTKYQKNIDALDKAHLWAWLGPLIGVLCAVIMAIVMVVLAVVTVVTGGAAAPILIAAIGATASMISAIVGAVTAVAVAAIILIDAICQWSSGTSMWTMLCNALGVKDQMLVDLISTIFEIVIQLVAIVATAGVFIAVAGISSAVKVSVKVAVETMKAMIKDMIASEVRSIVIKQSVQIVVTSLLSGGLVTDGLRKLGEKLLQDEKKAGIFAMVMTLIITIVTVVVTVVFSKGKGLATGLKSFIKTTASSISEKAGAIRESLAPANIAQAVREFKLSSVLTFVKNAGNVIVKHVKNFLTQLKNGLLLPFRTQETAEVTVAIQEAQPGRIGRAIQSVKASIAKLEAAVADLKASGTATDSVGTAGDVVEDTAKVSGVPKEVPGGVGGGQGKGSGMGAVSGTKGAQGSSGGAPSSTQSGVVVSEQGGAPSSTQSGVVVSEQGGAPSSPQQAAEPPASPSKAEGEPSVSSNAGEGPPSQQGQAMKSTEVAEAPTTVEGGSAEADYGMTGVTEEQTKIQKLLSSLGQLIQSIKDSQNVARAGATILLSLRMTLLQWRIALLKAASMLLTLIDHIMDALRQGMNTVLSMNITKYYADLLSFKGIIGPQALEIIAKKLLLITDLLKIVQMALQITAAAEQYKAAQTQIYFDELLAGLAQETAVLQAMTQFFANLSGLDQNKTISMIMDSAKESYENWVKILELVSSFITDAGERVSDLASKANM
jgi:hypothetical protein